MPGLEEWHNIVKEAIITDESKADAITEKLANLLTENCTFHAPVYLKPRKGRWIVALILREVCQILGAHFHYTREIVGGNNVCLEFKAQVDGEKIEGVSF